VLGRRWLSLLFLALVAVVWPSRASAWATTNAQTRVGVFEVAAHVVVGVASAASPGNRRAPSSAGVEIASGHPLAAKGGGGTSPTINPSDVAGKTPQEIDQIARNSGLTPKGPDPMGGKGAYVDPVTGEQRVLIHPDDPVPHAHVNDPAGNRLGPGGQVVPPESPGAHLPIRTVP